MAKKRNEPKEQPTDAARVQFMEELVSGENPNWEPIVGGKNLKLEEGESIEGRIVKLPYKAGKSNAFDITVSVAGEEDETVTYWSPTILTNLLKKVKEGDYVVIKCLGSIPTSNGDAYDFAVARRKRN